MGTGVLEAIDNAAREGVDTWEMLVSAGIEASDNKSQSHWDLGDLARKVKTSYGEDALGKYAKEIKQPVDRLREYRTVCDFWDENSVRTEFLAELKNVYYSHYLQAMRLKDMAQAVAFIEECHMNDWSVEQARLELDERLGKPKPPAKLVDSELRMQSLERGVVTFELAADAVQRLFPSFDAKRPVRLVIYDTKDLKVEGSNSEGSTDKRPS